MRKDLVHRDHLKGTICKTIGWLLRRMGKVLTLTCMGKALSLPFIGTLQSGFKVTIRKAEDPVKMQTAMTSTNISPEE